MRIHVWDANGAPIAAGSGGGGGSADFTFSHFVAGGGEAAITFEPPNAPFYELIIAALGDGDSNPFQGVVISFNDDEDSANYYSFNRDAKIDDSPEDFEESVVSDSTNGLNTRAGVAETFPDVVGGNILKVLIQNVLIAGTHRQAQWEAGFAARSWVDIREADIWAGTGEWLSEDAITKITIKPGLSANFAEGSVFILRSIGA